MNAFTRDDFVAWMERLAHVPWPLTLDAFTDLAPELGWTFTGYQYSFTADFAAGKRDVVVLKNRAGDVRSISFILVKPALEGIALRAALNDSFIEYVTSASQAWGNRSEQSQYTTNKTRPASRAPGRLPHTTQSSDTQADDTRPD